MACEIPLKRCQRPHDHRPHEPYVETPSGPDLACPGGPLRKPNTFWLIGGRHYWLDGFGRYHNVEDSTMPLLSLRDVPGVQLHLVSTS